MVDRLDSVHAVPIQPLACVLHALSRVPNLAGTRAAVIGLGPIGLLFAHAIKDAGARSVHGVDVIDRRELASTYLLDDVTRGSSWSWGSAAEFRDSFDLVVEAVGHQSNTVTDAITVAARGGHVICFGNPSDARYPIPFDALMRKNLTLYAGRTPQEARRDALRRAQAYLTRYPELADAYVTHVLSVHDVQEAYNLARPSRAGSDQDRS